MLPWQQRHTSVTWAAWVLGGASREKAHSAHACAHAHTAHTQGPASPALPSSLCPSGRLSCPWSALGKTTRGLPRQGRPSPAGDAAGLPGPLMPSTGHPRTSLLCPPRTILQAEPGQTSPNCGHAGDLGDKHGQGKSFPSRLDCRKAALPGRAPALPCQVWSVGEGGCWQVGGEDASPPLPPPDAPGQEDRTLFGEKGTQ